MKRLAVIVVVILIAGFGASRGYDWWNYNVNTPVSTTSQPVQFHIDVIGHKWFFNKVARVLEGDAEFYVDPARAGRIVDIQGNLL